MIHTEPTPNPESLKFLSDNIISNIGTEEFQANEIKNVNNLFVKELLSFKGVELVLLSKNFLSVKKTKDISWSELKPMVISHLNHYFESNKDPILTKDKLKNTHEFLDYLNEKENEIEKNKIEILEKLLPNFINIPLKKSSLNSPSTRRLFSLLSLEETTIK